MATLEQLKGHIDKAKSEADEAVKNAGDNKYDATVRKTKKKFKRLSRKAGKIVYFEKMKADKANKNKKEGGGEG